MEVTKLPPVPDTPSSSKASSVRYEISVLLVFVILGINMPLAVLNEYLAGGLIVMAVFIFVARPLTVLACLLPDRRGRWTRNEIVFLS